MRLSRVGWALMTTLSVLVVVIASRYLQFDPSTYFPQQRQVYVERELALGVHIAGAMVALATGPWQFSSRLRRRRPRVHRAIGVSYLMGCLVGGVGGLMLASTAHGGVVASLGFAALAGGWMLTSAIGLRMILNGRVADHRRWMVRSFSLTFAAVTLRLLPGCTAGFSQPDSWTWASPRRTPPSPGWPGCPTCWSRGGSPALALGRARRRSRPERRELSSSR